MHRLILSTGSNLGNRKNNLESAAELTEDRIGKILKSSAIYESPSWGYESKNSFYNQCLVLETELGPDDVLGLMLGVEHFLGRKREKKGYSDRIIDIDILFYNDLILDSATLKIPHPGIADRRFVLVPLAEIVPSFVHPVLSLTILELLDRCPDKLAVYPLKID